MKPYCICIALFLLFNSLSAEIKNGYAAGISTARTSLDVFSSLLKESGWAPHRRRSMEAKRLALVKYITYHDLTENLLKQLEIIAPELYNEIDTIKDSNGKITDVYVRFIPEDEASVEAWGITGIAHVPGDADTYLSEYGAGSVSVKVWAVSQALLVLAHELGHVKYIVPNLSTYKAYHLARYPPCSRRSNHIGHDADDKSGKSAVEFEKRFKTSYYEKYLSNDIVRNDSPAVQVRKIRRKILSEISDAIPVARL